MKRPAVLIALTVALAACLVIGQDNPPPAAPARAPTAEVKPTTTLESYDIRSLLVDMPDYHLPKLLNPNAQNAGSVLTPAAAAAVPQRARQQMIDDNIKLITTSVSPESWRDAGGTIGAISHLNGDLFITQTAENHKAIADLLAKVKTRTVQTVRIEAHWLAIAPAELAALKHPAGMESLSIVSDETLKSTKVYCRGQVTMMNGQLNHIMSHVERNYISDLTPIVGANVVAYDPTMDKITTGVGLQIRPLVADPASAIVDVFTEVLEAPEAAGVNLAALGDNHPTTRPTDKPPFIDKGNVVYQTLHTTVRIPLATNVLVGGMTMEPAGKDTSGRELYLVLRADADKK